MLHQAQIPASTTSKPEVIISRSKTMISITLYICRKNKNGEQAMAKTANSPQFSVYKHNKYYIRDYEQ